MSIQCIAECALIDFVNLELAKATETKTETTTATAIGAGLDALDLIELGSIYVNEMRNLKPSFPLKAGDLVRIHSAPRRYAKPKDLKERILSEDSDSLLAEKPSGIPMEPTVDNLRENFLSFLEDSRGQKLFVTHRLAHESAGVLLIAKSIDAQARIVRAFAEGRVTRRFSVYALNPVAKGEHVAQLAIDSDLMHCSMNVLTCERRIGATHLLTERHSTWQVTGDPLNDVYRLEIELTEGRPKQIRVHLASLGAAVIGDYVYGSPIRLTDFASGKPALAIRVEALAAKG